MNFFIVFADELIISDGSGRELWRGKPDGHAVAVATPIPGSDDGLVLYEPYPEGWQRLPSFQNLARVRPDGSIRWRAELPNTSTKYVSAKLCTGGIKAAAPSYEVLIDLETGKILQSVWTK